MFFFSLLPQIGYSASSLLQLVKAHCAWGSGRHTHGVRPSISIIPIDSSGVPQIYSKKGSAYRLLRDWLVTYNKSFPGSKVFLWECFFSCLHYETKTDRGRGYTVIFMIPKREHSVFEMLDSPIYMLIAQKSHLFMGRTPTYTFKSVFFKREWFWKCKMRRYFSNFSLFFLLSWSLGRNTVR